MQGSLKGSQEPRIKVEPARVRTDGDGAVMLMNEYGYKLDEWQKIVLDCWLGKDSENQYTTMSAGLALPRQNGKNVCLEAREFFGMLVNGEKILHTAHQVRTSKKSFKRLVQMFTDKRHPEIIEAVKHIRFTNGEESIELYNGGMIEFSARSRQAARGYDGISLVIYDEAQELCDDQVEAIMATLSASSTGHRQIIYTGTPPYPNCPGDVFRRRREACMNGKSENDAWHEWSVDAESIEKIDVSNVELWYQCNPALGIRLSEKFTSEECRTMSPDGFARERLGWWTPVNENKTELALDPLKWEECASIDGKPDGKTAYGVKFSADGSEVCLAGAVIPADGKARITLIDRQPTGRGIRWLSEWLNDRYNQASCVVIDGRNGVDVLVDRIADVWRVKGSIVRPAVKDIIAAVSLTTDAVNENTLTWYKHQDALNISATTSTKRSLAGGYAFGGSDPAPIEACALALWGAKNTKRDPSKKMRIG